MNTVLNRLNSSGTKLTERTLGEQMFWFRNKEYPCIPTSEARGEVAQEGGFDLEIRLSIFVRREEMPDGLTVDSGTITIDSSLVPASRNSHPKTHELGKIIDTPNNQETTYSNGFRGTKYRVAGIKLFPNRDSFRLDLVDPA